MFWSAYPSGEFAGGSIREWRAPGRIRTHDPQICRGMVRAVGIEPTLLSEPHFEGSSVYSMPLGPTGEGWREGQSRQLSAPMLHLEIASIALETQPQARCCIPSHAFSCLQGAYIYGCKQSCKQKRPK